MKNHERTHPLSSPFLKACACEDVSIYARQVFLDIKARDMMERTATAQAAAVDRMFISPVPPSFSARTLI